MARRSRSRGGIGESRQNETNLIPRAVMALQGHVGDFAVCGADYDAFDGTAIRDYIHVTDYAAAHLQALNLTRDRETDGKSGMVEVEINAERIRMDRLDTNPDGPAV
jgi:UDP-glucose 4-epimerase